MGGTMLVVFLVFGIAVAVGSVVASRKQKNKWNDFFTKLAADFSLEFKPSSFGVQPSVSGNINRTPVYVSLVSFSAGKHSVLTLCYRMSLTERLACGLNIGVEGFFSNLDKKLSNKTDIELDTHAFDAAALVAGVPTNTARALLHPEAKQIITEMIGRVYAKKFQLSSGVLEVCIPVANIFSYSDVSNTFNALLRLAGLLDRKKSIPEMLSENYKAEITSSGKRAYLESLAGAAGELSEDNEIIQDALRSRGQALRFEAIKSMGKAGMKYVPAVFSTADESMKAEIIEYCGKYANDDIFAYFFDLRTGFQGKTKFALLKFFAKAANEKAGDYLSDQLQSGSLSTTAELRACIRALGKCGSYKSIGIVDKVKNISLKRDKDQAIAEIQSRIGAGDAGWLSMQKPDAGDGNLSITESGDKK